MSAIVAYIATRDVRHLASWTQDRDQESEWWPSGSYRPICGDKVVGPRRRVIWPDLPYEDEKLLGRAMAKPVCKHCLKTLRALAGVS